MIADRVVLLPGCHVGRKTVMGSGALGKRDTIYEDGSTWMGCGKREMFHVHFFGLPKTLQIMAMRSALEGTRRNLMRKV